MHIRVYTLSKFGERASIQDVSPFVFAKFIIDHLSNAEGGAGGTIVHIQVDDSFAAKRYYALVGASEAPPSHAYLLRRDSLLALNINRAELARLLNEQELGEFLMAKQAVCRWLQTLAERATAEAASTAMREKTNTVFPDATHEPGEYNMIEAFGELMGMSDSAISAMQHAASRQRAPIDTVTRVFNTEGEGGWLRLCDIKDETLAAKLRAISHEAEESKGV